MTPEERIDALEASLVGLWQIVQEMTEADKTPQLEKAHRAMVARLKANRAEAI